MNKLLLRLMLILSVFTFTIYTTAPSFAQMIPQIGPGPIQLQQTGTWTPTDASGASLTFSAVSAGWTKIGNMVFAYGTVTYPSTASAANASIGGLPFTSANSAYSRAPFPFFGSLGVTAYGVVSQNATTFNVVNASSAAQITNITLSTSLYRFLVIYPVQ